jgi:hypothetical protein
VGLFIFSLFIPKIINMIFKRDEEKHVA